MLLVLGVVSKPSGMAVAEGDSAPAPTVSANSAAPAPPPGEKGAGGGLPAAAETDKTPQPVAAPTVDLKAACKKTVATLGSGDLSAVEALPSDKRGAFLQDSKTGKVFACLAIADDNKRYCEALPQERRDECLHQWQLLHDLKSQPKASLKSILLYQSCLSHEAKEDCEKLREAITAGDDAKCKAMSKAPSRDFCAAVATGDAKRCQGLPQGAQREYCTALATNDPARCPKESEDCTTLVRGLAKKKGLEGFQDIDPTLAAAAKGRSACTALLATLEGSCAAEQRGNAAVATAPNPGATPQ